MLNKVTLIGRLGQDPEIRNTQGGKKMANLSVATSERWKGRDGQQQERTEWHRVVIFNEGLAGVAERYLHKGSLVYLEGSLQTRKWQDQSGQDRYTTEVVLSQFGSTLTMLGGKDDREAPPPAGDDYRSTGRSSAPGGDLDDKIPDDGDLDDEIPF